MLILVHEGVAVKYKMDLDSYSTFKRIRIECLKETYCYSYTREVKCV